MLSIFFGDFNEANYIHNPKAYFDSSREDAWLECAWVKRMVADIDRSELVSPHLVISPVLGAISPDRLSGGAKTLILIAHDERHVFNASVCGDNCAPWLLRIGMEQDVLIRLSHLMHFAEEPYEIRIANTGEVVHTQKELVCSVIRQGLLDFTHLS